jgi:SPFH domain-Band 7 family
MSRWQKCTPEAPMSLQDAIRTQLIEIIEWVDDSRETLSYRFPDQDKEIKRGAKLIVRESQAVQFVRPSIPLPRHQMRKRRSTSPHRGLVAQTTGRHHVWRAQVPKATRVYRPRLSGASNLE